MVIQQGEKVPTTLISTGPNARGNGATVLLYNRERQTVILTRQFRYPAYVNGHHGMLIEACAGLRRRLRPGQ